jgi:hypothetical protein
LEAVCDTKLNKKELIPNFREPNVKTDGEKLKKKK